LSQAAPQKPALGIRLAKRLAFARRLGVFGERQDARAPEIAKNACIVGDLIPTFALGIPGSSVTAIFLAAMIMHGLQPGAEFFSHPGVLPYTVFAGILLAQVSFFIMGLLFARQFVKAVLIPNALLVPIIVVLSFIASLALRGDVEDMLVTFIFGIIGYLMSIYRYPAACIVLGLVLGDLVEANFHRSILIGHGSYMIFFTRPASLILFILTIVMLAWPYLKFPVRRRGA